jgi:hypothetical protein
MTMRMVLVGYAGACACAAPTAHALADRTNNALAPLAAIESIGSSWNRLGKLGVEKYFNLLIHHFF